MYIKSKPKPQQNKHNPKIISKKSFQLIYIALAMRTYIYIPNPVCGVYMVFESYDSAIWIFIKIICCRKLIMANGLYERLN